MGSALCVVTPGSTARCDDQRVAQIGHSGNGNSDLGVRHLDQPSADGAEATATTFSNKMRGSPRQLVTQSPGGAGGEPVAAPVREPPQERNGLGAVTLRCGVVTSHHGHLCALGLPLRPRATSAPSGRERWRMRGTRRWSTRARPFNWSCRDGCLGTTTIGARRLPATTPFRPLRLVVGDSSREPVSKQSATLPAHACLGCANASVRSVHVGVAVITPGSPRAQGWPRSRDPG